MNIDAIPSELRGRPQWVVWMLEERDGKLTKVPYRCDGNGKASTTDPATWGSYSDAVAAAQELPAHGVGFVFSPDDPYVGVDLDNLEADAGAIILALSSYTEHSVSGRGAHVIVRANLNGHTRRRQGPLEIYSEGRYFVVTGEHMRGTPAAIEDRQAELERVLAAFLPAEEPKFPTALETCQPVDLDDQELIDRALHAKNGAKFARLWRGDTSDYDHDDSRADLALCGLLAFWTGRDPDRIDRMFRASGLMRDKWLRDDYRKRTIDAAVAACSDVYDAGASRTATHPETQDEAFRLEPVDWQSVVAGGIPRLEYLAEPFLPRRKRIWAVGPAESGKSIWAAAKSAERSRAGDLVVYFSQENGLEEEARRFLRLHPDFARLHLYVDQGLDLKLPDHREAVLATVEGAALVVFDTLTACWTGDEDSNEDLNAFDRDVLKPLVALGASSLVLDHTGNPQPFARRRGVSAPRGASSKGQKTDFLLEFKAAGDGGFRVERGKKRGTHGKEPRDYQVVDTPDDGLELVESVAEERDLVGEIAELMAENDEVDWWTANKLKQPKGNGGVGADVNTVKAALEDDCFENAEGAAIGKRKDSTWYRLKEAS